MNLGREKNEVLDALGVEVKDSRIKVERLGDVQGWVMFSWCTPTISACRVGDSGWDARLRE